MRKICLRILAVCMVFAVIMTILPAAGVHAAKKKGTVSRTEVLAAVEKILGAKELSKDMSGIRDVKKSDKCYKTMSIALNAGMIQADADGKLKPYEKADYGFLASVLGAVTEKPSQTFLGKKSQNAKLTKKELLAVLKKNFPKVIKKSTNKAGSGNVVINKPGVVLRNVTIKGDLYISEGAAAGEVTLEKVTVKGTMVVRAGGKKQKVELKDSKVDALVVAEKAEDATIFVDAGSTVEKATVNAEGTALKGAGKVKTVDVNVEKAVIETKTDASQIHCKVKTVAYKTDERYEKGYPTINLDKASGSIEISYKLKEGAASQENPVEIYSIISEINDDATTEAVLHGHLGVVDEELHQKFCADSFDYHKITDSEVHTYKYTSSGIFRRGIFSYSVISGRDGISDVPTKVFIEGEAGSGFVDKSAPWPVAEYYNQKRDKVYIQMYEKLDKSSVPEASCFTVRESESDSEARECYVTKVEIQNEGKAESGSFSHNFVILTLNKALAQDQKYYVQYTKPGSGKALQDVEKNTTESFGGKSGYGGLSEILPAAPEITDIYLADDNSSLTVWLKPGFNLEDIKNRKIAIEVDGTAYDLNMTCSSDMYTSVNLDKVEIRIKNPKMKAGDSHTFRIKAKDGKSVKDIAGDAFASTEKTEFTKVKKFSIDNIQYDKATGKMTINVSGDQSAVRGYLCSLVFEVDGKEYTARGMTAGMSATTEEIAAGKGRIEVDAKAAAHIPFASAAEIKARFAPGGDSFDEWIDKSGRCADPQENIPVEVVEGEQKNPWDDYGYPQYDYNYPQDDYSYPQDEYGYPTDDYNYPSDDASYFE